METLTKPRKYATISGSFFLFFNIYFGSTEPRKGLAVSTHATVGHGHAHGWYNHGEEVASRARQAALLSGERTFKKGPIRDNWVVTGNQVPHGYLVPVIATPTDTIRTPPDRRQADQPLLPHRVSGSAPAAGPDRPIVDGAAAGGAFMGLWALVLLLGVGLFAAIIGGGFWAGLVGLILLALILL